MLVAASYNQVGRRLLNDSALRSCESGHAAFSVASGICPPPDSNRYVVSNCGF
jgi:hypothetical protein